MSSQSESKPVESETPATNSNNILYEIIYSPVNLILTLVIVVLIYKIIKSKFGKIIEEAPAPELPKIRKDMTVAELRKYDGSQEDGRVLVAVNGWIFDVTRGRRFYGPGEFVYLLIDTFVTQLPSVQGMICINCINILVSHRAIPIW